ncbi:MAG: NADH-quinone oxidoreductase subunit [Actinomycetota bacterium]|nr:NADH-quinone oxidoreductase subunit [Actinomycetota bacterium]
MTVTANPPAAGSAPRDVPEDMITFTIDGIEVSVPRGTLVIRAAEQIGIVIPRFCDHPLLKPVGACRQCLVEVATPGPDGTLRPMPKPQTSCTLQATPGMVVRTQLTSPVAAKAQRGVLELLLINHPLDCPVCDKGGECPLQNQAMSHGEAESRFTGVKRTFPKPIRVSTQVLLDRERCVLCQRCTRFTKEIAGDAFIDLQMRGAHQQIGTFSPQDLDFAGGAAPVGEAQQDESGRPFASYFSGNTVQICPVGALTGAAYRFRARPFDLVSVPSVCEHCASGCELRIDHRRGKVLRRMAGNDPAVNEEWNCDKGRWAFPWATATDRLTTPLVRDEQSGELRPASWAQALTAAALGLRAAGEAGGVGLLPGGRVTVEDAYAWALFARTALGTDDIDFRARVHSAEETAFLAHAVAGTGLGVTYTDLESAPAVLLAGLEPEEESPILFLRLRKAVLGRGLQVHAVAPFATRGLIKMNGDLVPAAPGTETEVLRAVRTGAAEVSRVTESLRREGAVLLVGERLAGVPGALGEVLRLVQEFGLRMAWVPRRAGERGALEAGALPGLLPGGRPLSDRRAREEVLAVRGSGDLPSSTGRDTTAILQAAATGGLGGLVVGGVDPADLPDPQGALKALRAVDFLVSLEVRSSAVTALADVVLPVAPAQEKAGTYLTWEGRPRPFEAVLGTAALSDHRVLDALSDALGSPLRLRGVEAIRSELERFGAWDGERAEPRWEPSAAVPRPSAGQAVLATWKHLLDRGRLQDGEPHLAGTAPRPVARLSAATAGELGLARGSAVTVRTETGSLTLPVAITDIPDRVVWVPSASGPSTVLAELGATAGSLVGVAAAASDGDTDGTIPPNGPAGARVGEPGNGAGE